MKNKMNNKIFGGIILGFIVISLIVFDVVQVMFNESPDSNYYSYRNSENLDMYKTGGVTLTPQNADAELMYFKLTLLRLDPLHPEYEIGDILVEGMVTGLESYTFYCEYGVSGDDIKDCHLEVEYWKEKVYAYEGQSCSEDWEFCRSGDDTSCVSGICVANDECSIDSECPNGGWDDVAYCDGGDVVRDYLEGDCYFGDCRFVVDKQNIESCDFGCEDGSCLAEVVDPVTPVDPVEPTVTCTDGEFRYTNDLIYVCGVQTPVKEICVSNNWEQVIVKNTNCGVVNETTPVTPLNPTNPECNVGDTQIFTYDINCEGDTSSVVINCVNGVWQKINYEALDCELSWIERVQNGDINISSILITLISGGVVIFLISYLRKNPQILNAIKKSKK